MDDAWKPFPRCPAEDCEETEGVTIMECVPGYSYMMVGDVCFHWVTLVIKPNAPVDNLLAEYVRQAGVSRETP